MTVEAESEFTGSTYLESDFVTFEENTNNQSVNNNNSNQKSTKNITYLYSTIKNNYSSNIFQLPNKNWTTHHEIHTFNSSFTSLFSNETKLAWFYLKHLLNLSNYQMQTIFDLIHSSYFQIVDTPKNLKEFDNIDLNLKLATQTVINVYNHI